MAEKPVFAGVIAALDFEAAAFASKSLCVRDLKLEICGMGSSAATRAARRLLAQGAGLLVSFGTAGALGQGVAGDIMVPDHVVDSSGNRCDAELAVVDFICRYLTGSAVVHRGMLLSVEQPLTDPAAKQTMHAGTGAEAVDLESAAIAKVAAGRVPFVAMRVIIDAADRAIPNVAVASVEGSAHRPGRILPALLKSPDQIPALISLGLAARRAGRSLRLCAAALAGAMTDPTLIDSLSGSCRR